MNGIVSAWGDNSNGQLGNGSTAGSHAPVEVHGLEGVRKVEAGSGHSIALFDDGTAVAWGRNAFGQVGDGSVTNQSRPCQTKLDGIVDIAPGGGQSLFLRDDGTVWGCGAGFFGVLGETNLGVHPVPVKIEGLSGVRQLVSGGGQGLALMEDGTVWSWGRNDYGQLGDGDETGTRPGHIIREHDGRGYACRVIPAKVPGLSGVRSIAAGGGQSLAVLDDGSLFAWGFNDRGQCGDGTMIHRSSPVKVEGLSGIRHVAGAYHHTLALLDDGTVWAFGMNDRGQLGDGTTTHRTRPVQVQGLRGARLIATTGGGSDVDPGGYGHSLALLDDGTVWAWGCNDHGELGVGDIEGRLVPTPVTGLTGVRHITAGGEVPAFREHPGGGFVLAIH